MNLDTSRDAAAPRAELQRIFDAPLRRAAQQLIDLGGVSDARILQNGRVVTGIAGERKIPIGRALLLSDDLSQLLPSLLVIGGEPWLIDITNCLSDRIGVACFVVGPLVIRASQGARSAHSIGGDRDAVVQPGDVPRPIEIETPVVHDRRVRLDRRRICVRGCAHERNG
jgi:hypothetical protein